MRIARLEIFTYLFLILFTLGCGLRGKTSPEFMQTKRTAESGRSATLQKDVKVMRQAVRLKPDDANDVWNLAAKYWSMGYIEQTAVQMRKYTKLDPDNAEAHNVIGLDCYCKELYNIALNEFRTAAKLNPEEKQYNYNEALVLVRLGRYDEADRAFERASGLKEGEYLRHVYAELISENRAKEMYNDGCTAMENLDSTRAIELFEAALEIRPGMVEAHVNLGVLYGMRDSKKSQVYHLEEAVRLRPDMPDIRYNLGLAYSDAKMYSQAIAEFKQAIELNPWFGAAHFKLGMVLCKTGNYTDAVPEFENCLKLSPDWFEAHLNLGTCYLKTGNEDGAIEQFKEAVRLKPDLAEAHYSLGAAYMNAERYDEASVLFRKALEIDPGHRQSRIMLKELEIYQEG